MRSSLFAGKPSLKQYGGVLFQINEFYSFGYNDDMHTYFLSTIYLLLII